MLTQTTSLTIRALADGDVEYLYAAYRAATRQTAHDRPPGLEPFIRSLDGAAPHLLHSAFLVASRGSVPVAFARVGVANQIVDRWTLSRRGMGMLFGPFGAPEDSEALDALIRAALGYWQERRALPALAFDPSEGNGFAYYNGGWAGLSESAAHVVTALTAAGFRIRHRELHLTLGSLDGTAPASPIRGDFQVERRADNRYTIRLLDGRHSLGACHCSRMYPRRALDPESERRGYIDGLAVVDRWQGRGFGRALMEEAIRLLGEIGCESVDLTTHADNLRAQNLYYSMGFRLADSSVTLAHT